MPACNWTNLSELCECTIRCILFDKFAELTHLSAPIWSKYANKIQGIGQQLHGPVVFLIRSDPGEDVISVWNKAGCESHDLREVWLNSVVHAECVQDLCISDIVANIRDFLASA